MADVNYFYRVEKRDDYTYVVVYMNVGGIITEQTATLVTTHNSQGIIPSTQATVDDLNYQANNRNNT